MKMTEHVVSPNIINIGMLVGNMMIDEWNGMWYCLRPRADPPFDGYRGYQWIQWEIWVFGDEPVNVYIYNI